MKASQIQSHGGTEALKLIAASNGVKKLGPKEGRTQQVGDVRLTWKATGEDTGYATSFYEMDLPPGKGIALHSHPYAEVFYVVMGHTDFLRVDEQGQEEWVRCGPGDTLVAPMNALHAFHNRTDKPSRFISSSVYYHEVFFETYAPVRITNSNHHIMVTPKKDSHHHWILPETSVRLLPDAFRPISPNDSTTLGAAI